MSSEIKVGDFVQLKNSDRDDPIYEVTSLVRKYQVWFVNLKGFRYDYPRDDFVVVGDSKSDDPYSLDAVSS